MRISLRTQLQLFFGIAFVALLAFALHTVVSAQTPTAETSPSQAAPVEFKYPIEELGS